jgi:hypothetical protein
MNIPTAAIEQADRKSVLPQSASIYISTYRLKAAVHISTLFAPNQPLAYRSRVFNQVFPPAPIWITMLDLTRHWGVAALHLEEAYVNTLDLQVMA